MAADEPIDRSTSGSTRSDKHKAPAHWGLGNTEVEGAYNEKVWTKVSFKRLPLVGFVMGIKLLWNWNVRNRKRRLPEFFHTGTTHE